MCNTEETHYKTTLAEKILKSLPSEKNTDNCHKDLRAKREIYNSAIQDCKKVIREILLND